MAVLCDIKVLEDWFEVNALVLDGSSVLFQEVINSLHLFWVSCKIFSSSEKRIVLSDSGNSCLWIFVDTSSCESFVDISYESCVLKEAFRVISLVFCGQKFKLIIC